MEPGLRPPLPDTSRAIVAQSAYTGAWRFIAPHYREIRQIIPGGVKKCRLPVARGHAAQ